MLYYSEKTKQTYKTEEELIKAEAKLEGEKQMKEHFKELLDACDNINKVRREAVEKIAKAETKYDDMKADFIELYGEDNYNELKAKEDEFYYGDKYYHLSSTNSTNPDTVGENNVEEKVEEDQESKKENDSRYDLGIAFGFTDILDDIFDYFSSGWKK